MTEALSLLPFDNTADFLTSLLSSPSFTRGPSSIAERIALPDDDQPSAPASFNPYAEHAHLIPDAPDSFQWDLSVNNGDLGGDTLFDDDVFGGPFVGDPFADDASPVADCAPVADAASPVADDARSVTDAASPVADCSSPLADDAPSVADAASPVADVSDDDDASLSVDDDASLSDDDDSSLSDDDDEDYEEQESQRAIRRRLSAARAVAVAKQPPVTPRPVVRKQKQAAPRLPVVRVANKVPRQSVVRVANKVPRQSVPKVPRTVTPRAHARPAYKLPDSITAQLKTVSHNRCSAGPSSSLHELDTDVQKPEPTFGFEECHVPGYYPQPVIPVRSNLAIKFKHVWLKTNTPGLIGKLVRNASGAAAAASRACEDSPTARNKQRLAKAEAELAWRQQMHCEYNTDMGLLRLAYQARFDQSIEPSDFMMLPDIGLLADYHVRRYRINTNSLSFL